jgi:hypothetical protein
MALSPNYSWVEPDNSSLVKNGAQDIRALGDAIDTSVWNIGYGQAGKNKIINGDFGIWQRGTGSFAANTYSADRWTSISDATVATTQQSFTAGTAPVAGYEGQFFLRTTKSAGGSFVIQEQRIEDVRDFAGQTVTLSFWAKADAAVTIAPVLVQFFGTGGSASVDTTLATASLTTSWARYSMSVAVPSIAGKTIGAGNYLGVRPVRALTASATTIDLWGVQIEAGSVATPFQTASGGSPQAELAMCQRYYQKSYAQSTAVPTNSQTAGIIFAPSVAVATGTYFGTFKLPITMRTAPSVTIYSFNTSQTSRVSDGSGTDLGANSGVAALIGESQISIQNSSGGIIAPALGGFVFHYVASAEL